MSEWVTVSGGNDEWATVAAPKVDTRSAPARFLSGIWSQINPGNLVHAVTHPVDTVRHLVDTRPQFMDAAESFARAIPGGNIEPSVMDPHSRLDYAAHGARKAVESIPVIGPIAGAVTDQIIDRAGSGDLAGAIGTGVGAAAVARAPVEKVPGAFGAKIAKGAERAYAGAFGGGELAEAMAPAMMARGYKPTSALAAEAEAAAAGASTEASALSAASAATHGRRGAAAMRDPIEAAREAAVREAEFQRNVATIAEAIPQSKTLTNILVDGVKTGAKTGVVGVGLHALDRVSGGVATAAATVATATKTLAELRKTPMWQASTAMARKSFGEALQRKDLLTAANIGAQIASGAMLVDDYGHASAVGALQGEVSQYDSPDLRRQAIAAKSAYYVDPNGKRIAIPPSVMSEFVHTPALTSVQSPIQAWLSAMNKQGHILKGGTLEFTGANGAQSGYNWQAPGARGAPQTDAVAAGHEFPVNKDRERIFLDRSRNSSSPTMRPDLLVPPGFSGPATVEYGIAPDDRMARLGVGGIYGADLRTLSFNPNDRKNTVLINPDFKEEPATWIHELGHSIDYTGGLGEKERAAYNDYFTRTSQAFQRMVDSADGPTMRALQDQINGRAPYNVGFPKAVVLYYLRHKSGQMPLEAAIHESFAESFAMSQINPEAFKQKYPQDYELIRSIVSSGNRRR